MFGESLWQCFYGFRRRPSHSTPLPASLNASITTSSSSCVSSVVFKNFNSLYDPISSSSSSCDDCGGGSCPSEPERDLSAAIASRRLQPAPPGRSNSIVDSPAVAVGAGAGMAVPTYSPDPYRDFRRSMEEMVAVLGLEAAHRARLHELLLCYLALNRKEAHEYIVSAFADLLLALASTGVA